jgi:hypothetical protein
LRCVARGSSDKHSARTAHGARAGRSHTSSPASHLTVAQPRDSPVIVPRRPSPPSWSPHFLQRVRTSERLAHRTHPHPRTSLCHGTRARQSRSTSRACRPYASGRWAGGAGAHHRRRRCGRRKPARSVPSAARCWSCLRRPPRRRGRRSRRVRRGSCSAARLRCTRRLPQARRTSFPLSHLTQACQRPIAGRVSTSHRPDTSITRRQRTQPSSSLMMVPIRPSPPSWSPHFLAECVRISTARATMQPSPRTSPCRAGRARRRPPTSRAGRVCACSGSERRVRGPRRWRKQAARTCLGQLALGVGEIE